MLQDSLSSPWPWTRLPKWADLGGLTSEPRQSLTVSWSPPQCPGHDGEGSEFRGAQMVELGGGGV